MVCFDDSDCRSGVCEHLSLKGLKPEQLPCKCDANPGDRNPDGDGIEPLCCRYCKSYPKSEGENYSQEIMHSTLNNWLCRLCTGKG
jgi:hypothetical protein